MTEESICRFAPVSTAPDVIQILHFVYETQNQLLPQRRLDSMFRVCLAEKGTATLTCGGKQQAIAPGDVFFTFPATPYSLQGSADFRYYYISFMGIRGGMLLEQLQVNSRRNVFSGLDELLPFWDSALKQAAQRTDLAGESVLLYTLLQISQRVSAEEKESGFARNVMLVKKYMDDHFADPELSVASISQNFSYNPKYISAAFKKQYKVGMQEYLTGLRINHACALMQQGYTSVNDIAGLCGYGDALYFSKVFRKQMQSNPRQYIKMLKSAQKNDRGNG